jgi:hypothetical protein
MEKIASRKFLLSLAAFLAAFAGGAGGVIPPEWCTLGMALSAGIYAACEAYVDGKAAEAKGFQTICVDSASEEPDMDASEDA